MRFARGIRLLARACVAACVTSHSVYAQSAPPAEAPMPFEKGVVELTVLGGTTLPTSWLRAKADHNLTLASFQAGRVMAGGPDGNNFELLVDVAPLMVIRQPELVRGWSVSPLFMRWNFPPAGARGPRIFAEASGGLLFTTAPVPVRTTSFNFIDQAGFGVRIEESTGRAWVVGYRFQHISNAGRVKPNPGKNFNFVYVGISFIR